MIPTEKTDERRKHFDVEVNPDDRALTKAEQKEKIKGRDVVISLLTDATDGEVLDAAGPQLKIVANYAVGFNNFDLVAATKRSVVLTNTPGVLDDATATRAFTRNGLLPTENKELNSFAIRHTNRGAYVGAKKFLKDTGLLPSANVAHAPIKTG